MVIDGAELKADDYKSLIRYHKEKGDFPLKNKIDDLKQLAME